MKRFKLYSVFVVLLIMVGAAATAAPNIYGITGGLEMPNDLILCPSTVSLGYWHGFNVDDRDWNFFTGTVGLIPNFEVGVGFGIPDEGDTDVSFNAKYRLIPETIDRPAVTVGVVDIAEEYSGNPGLFILLSKTLTTVAEDITGEPSKPLRGHIGFGSGIYDGVLLGLDWTMSPKAQIGFEYLNRGIEDGDPNLYLRYALTNEVRVDVGTIGFDSFIVGVSYSSLKF